MFCRAFAATLATLTTTIAGAQQNHASTAGIGPAGPLSTLAAPLCTDADPAPSYATCALRNDGLIIRRGVTGEVVARPGFVHGPALTPVVFGDSAIAYAALFEHQHARSAQFAMASSVAMASGFIMFRSACRVGSHSSCHHSAAFSTATIALPVVGMSLLFPATYLGHRASQSLSRALWWNNARFAR
jgi:hypothetical protein